MSALYRSNQGSSSALKGAVAIGLFAAVAFSTAPVSAQDFNFKGSLRDGLHTRYVPPLANPLFNETPYITTEIRPLFIYNKLPNDFLTRGGDIRVVAAEIRVALTDRLGIIASSDGFADANFNAVLRTKTASSISRSG